MRTHRKPLLLRGARQVGKTHAVRVLGQRPATEGQERLHPARQDHLRAEHRGLLPSGG